MTRRGSGRRIVATYAREEKVGPYLKALEANGVSPDRLLPLSPSRAEEIDLESLLGEADGLLLSGGGDVEPRLYGEEPLADPPLDTPLPERDRLESLALDVARRRRLPVLAICRGLQILNVRLGGSLWQDLPRQTGIEGHNFPTSSGFPSEHRAHSVAALAGRHPMQVWLSRFGPIAVNSRHHQAVKSIAPELTTVAESPDGVIEAIAFTDPSWWAWAIQWHPENLIGDEPHRGLFREFLAAVEAER